MIKCPNINHSDWKAIEAKYGEDTAWAAYRLWGEEIPSLAEVDNYIETFGDTDSELTNSNIINNQDQVDRDNTIVTASKSAEVKDEQVVSNVVDAITKQLEAMGIGIGVLEGYQNINGVFDPNGVKDLATGLINLIKVAKGERGQQAIPEEFAHFVDLILKQQNSPLYGRLNTLLNSEEIIKEVFEREEVGSYEIYKSLYQNDPEALRTEARGKLLARHIIRGEQIKQPLLAPLLQRLKNLFNRIFGKGNPNQLATDLYKADVEYSKIALKIIDGSIDLNFNLNSIRGNRVLYNAQSSLDSSKKALKAIIDLRAKQLQINKDFLSQDQIDALEGDISSLTYQYGKDTEILDGIINGTQKALDDFKELQLETASFKVDMSEGSDQAMKVSRHLRKIKSYVNAYTPLVSGLIDYTNSTEFKAMGVDAIKDSVNELLVVINTANSEYFRNSQPLFLEFIKQYSKGLIGSEWKGEVFTEEMFNRLIFESSKDIGIAERWLYSMSNTSDIMLGLIEQPVKEATWKQMQEVNEIVRTMQGAQEKLEKAGYKTDFIYEVDSKGVPTGYLLQPIDNARFREDKEKKKAELVKKWGHPVDSNPNRHTYWQMLHRWERANTENDGTPNKIKYASKAYNNMNAAQREFYNTILAEKEKAMKALPERRQDLFLAPQVRKDQMESIKDSRNLTDAWNRMSSALGDRWLVRDTDDVFGETITGEENGKKYVLKGFDGREIEKIPIYYSKKMDNTANLSLDIVSSMTLYVDMATRYKYMNEIVDIMEIGRDIMREKRQISQTEGGKELQEKIQTAGRTISNKLFKPKEASLFMDRLNDFYSAQIYGVSQKDEGSFKVLGKDVSWAKLANEVNKLTALNTYAVNTLGAVANVATGLAQNRLETIAGEHLGIKESAKADRIYAKWLPQILGDLGRRRDTSLPSLLMQKFNVHQDYDQAIKGLEMNRKNLLSRIFTGSSVFFMNNAGEHYLAAKVFIAMSERIKLKDKLGKSVSLINAFEVRKDASGVERIYLKDGIVKQDGSEFTDKDIMNFSRKVAKVHQDLHGIYNKEDMNAFQKLAIGRMIFMFRKWMPTAFGRRIDKAKYNFDLEQYQEGFYRTTGRFLKNLYNDLRQGQINMAIHWDSLNSHEKSNVYRALTEIGYLIAVAGAYALLSTAWEDDDEWIKDFTLYQIRRQQAEVGTMVPTVYTQFSEGLNIIQSPAAAMDYSQHLINVLRVWDIWKDPIASGTYEGWNPYMRDLVRPLPYHNAIRRTFYPKESIKAFTL